MAAQRSCLLAAVLAAAMLGAAAPAAAQRKPEAVSSCDSFIGALDAIKAKWDAATKATPLSTTIKLACDGNFTGCPSWAWNMSVPANYPNNTKLPRVSVRLQGTYRCRSKSSRVGVQSDRPTESISLSFTRLELPIEKAMEKLYIYATQVESSSFQVTLSGPGIDAKFSDIWFTGSSFISAESIDTLGVSQAWIGDTSSTAIMGKNITKSVSIVKAIFDNCTNAVDVSVAAGVPVTVRSSGFISSPGGEGGNIRATFASGKVKFIATKTVVSGAGNVVCIDSPSPGYIETPVGILPGSNMTPLKPNKTALPFGWPTTAGCSIAAFSQNL